MKHSIPFPNGGGDWRFDAKTGRLTDGPAPAAPPVAPEPQPVDVKPAANPRKRSTRKS